MEVKKRGSKGRMAFVGFCIFIFCACYLAREAGYHYYFAKGLTVEETISRYGKPHWTDTGPADSSEIHLFYYSGILNVVDLKCTEGRVDAVDIYIED